MHPWSCRRCLSLVGTEFRGDRGRVMLADVFGQDAFELAGFLIKDDGVSLLGSVLAFHRDGHRKLHDEGALRRDFGPRIGAETATIVHARMAFDVG